MERVDIHVSTIPGQRVRISFDAASDAVSFLNFVERTNENCHILLLESVYSKLGLSMPDAFAYLGLGWFTPVNYDVLYSDDPTVVYLDQPMRGVTRNAAAWHGEGVAVASFREPINPWCRIKPLAFDEWNQYREASNSGVYWKSLERFKPISPIWKRLASSEPEAPEPELPYPTKVIRSGPMTIAVWPDKSKTYVRIKDDDMSLDDPEKALALVTLKKLLGPHKFRKLFKEFLDKKES